MKNGSQLTDSCYELLGLKSFLNGDKNHIKYTPYICTREIYIIMTTELTGMLAPNSVIYKELKIR